MRSSNLMLSRGDARPEPCCLGPRPALCYRILLYLRCCCLPLGILVLHTGNEKQLINAFVMIYSWCWSTLCHWFAGQERFRAACGGNSVVKDIQTVHRAAEACVRLCDWPWRNINNPVLTLGIASVWIFWTLCLLIIDNDAQEHPARMIVAALFCPTRETE